MLKLWDSFIDLRVFISHVGQTSAIFVFYSRFSSFFLFRFTLFLLLMDKEKLGSNLIMQIVMLCMPDLEVALTLREFISINIVNIDFSSYQKVYIFPSCIRLLNFLGNYLENDHVHSFENMNVKMVA